MSEIRLTPHRLTPDMVIAAQDGRVLLRVDLNDGTVEGSVEDMSEAGRIFVEHVRSMFGAATTALSSPPADDVREALAARLAEHAERYTRYYQPCGDPGCTFMVRKGDGGWNHVDTHGVEPGHPAIGLLTAAAQALAEVRPYGTVTDAVQPVELYYCPEHGDLLPRGSAETRSLRCAEAHSVEQIRSSLSPRGTVTDAEALAKAWDNGNRSPYGRNPYRGEARS